MTCSAPPAVFTEPYSNGVPCVSFIVEPLAGETIKCNERNEYEKIAQVAGYSPYNLIVSLLESLYCRGLLMFSFFLFFSLLFIRLHSITDAYAEVILSCLPGLTFTCANAHSNQSINQSVKLLWEIESLTTVSIREIPYINFQGFQACYCSWWRLRLQRIFGYLDSTPCPNLVG